MFETLGRRLHRAGRREEASQQHRARLEPAETPACPFRHGGGAAAVVWRSEGVCAGGRHASWHPTRWASHGHSLAVVGPGISASHDGLLTARATPLALPSGRARAQGVWGNSPAHVQRCAPPCATWGKVSATGCATACASPFSVMCNPCTPVCDGHVCTSFLRRSDGFPYSTILMAPTSSKRCMAFSNGFF